MDNTLFEMVLFFSVWECSVTRTVIPRSHVSMLVHRGCHVKTFGLANEAVNGDLYLMQSEQTKLTQEIVKINFTR